MNSSDDLTICPQCDLLVSDAASVEVSGFTTLCPRCGAFLHRRHRNSLENSLALAFAALVLLVAGNIRYNVKGLTSVAGAGMRKSEPVKDAVS